MNLLDLDGGPLLCIDRMSLSQWGGVFRSSFFGSESTSANDYEEMCKRLSRRKSENLSLVKGVNAEALLIGIPLPTLIVEADGSSVYLVQIWSSEQGWSESSLTMDDFRSAADWRGDVRFFCGGGEFVIFDSSCSHEDIENHFSIYLERGVYRCESCHQKRKGQAEIVLISMLKQA